MNDSDSGTRIPVGFVGLSPLTKEQSETEAYLRVCEHRAYVRVDRKVLLNRAFATRRAAMGAMLATMPAHLSGVTAWCRPT